MSIVLFKEITTEEVLTQLEADGQKYAGLYVDMEDKKQRKYVKDSAALISGLLKKVERARIDKSKEYKANVEAEAKSITARLEDANKPFSLLIDAHNDKRKAELAEEKRVAEVKEAARLAVIAQDERDEHHEMAILQMAEYFRQLAKTKEQDRLDQITRDDAIALEATQKAEREAKEAIDKAEADKQAAIAEAKQAKIDADLFAKQAEERALADKIAAEKKAEADKQQAIVNEQNRVAAEQKQIEADTAKRESDTKHKRKINNEAMEAFILCGFDKDSAKKAVTAINKGFIPNVTISY